MLTIRPATRDDVPVIKMLIQELAEFERLPATLTEESLARDGFGPHPKFRVLMAEWQNQPAGYAFFFDFYSTFEGRAGIFLKNQSTRGKLASRAGAVQRPAQKTSSCHTEINT